MKGHPIIGALVVGTGAALVYGLVQTKVLKKPFPTSILRYAPWAVGTVAGYLMFR